ncbi:MAG: hypothetical protein WCQ70_01615 [Lentimicrobiaceae bacterium]
MAKRKRARRYRKITFKFTIQQKHRVDAYCRKHHTTPIHLYKKAIMLYLTRNGYGSDTHLDPVPDKNQLTIFDFLEEEISQEELL